MKNLLLSLAIISTLFTACKKESTDEAPTASDPTVQKQILAINPVPAIFTKKAFIESFTGASYNKCPETDALVENMIVNNPGRVIAAAIHQGDMLEIPFAKTINYRFNAGSVPPVPSYMISRIAVANKVFLTNQQMQGFTNKNFNMQAKCGLAINSAVSGRSAYIDVHAGFNQVIPGLHTLNVYLIENNVSKTGKGYDQLNTYNYVPSSAFFNMGDPIVGYVHQNVLRMVLTNDIGNTINPTKLVPNGHEMQHFVADIPGYINLNEVYIVAFVNKVGASPITHEVLNAQIAKLGTLKNWD